MSIHCVRCQTKIPTERLELVENTSRCARCQEKYELVEYGYEFFQLYSEAITSGPRNPGPKLLRKMAEAVLLGMFLACYAVVKLVSNSFHKKESKRWRKRR